MSIVARYLARALEASLQDLSPGALCLAVSYILVSGHFEYFDDALPCLFLQPKLTDLDMSYLAQTRPGRNANSCARITLQIPKSPNTDCHPSPMEAPFAVP